MLGFRTQPWHRPTSTYCGRTPMQARGSLLFLHLVYCVYASVCMHAAAMAGHRLTPSNPLAHTHCLGTSYSLDRSSFLALSSC